MKLLLLQDSSKLGSRQGHSDKHFLFTPGRSRAIVPVSCLDGASWQLVVGVSILRTQILTRSCCPRILLRISPDFGLTSFHHDNVKVVLGHSLMAGNCLHVALAGARPLTSTTL